MGFLVKKHVAQPKIRQEGNKAPFSDVYVRFRVQRSFDKLNIEFASGTKACPYHD